MSEQTHTDPYTLLGVRSDATEEEITAAYRVLAKQYHPDLNPGDETAAAHMREINRAYEALRGQDPVLAKPEEYEEYHPDYGNRDRRRAAWGIVRRIVLFLCALAMVGGVIFQACVMS